MNYYMDLFILMDYATISASAVAIGVSVAALVMAVRLKREALHAREEARKLVNGEGDSEGHGREYVGM